MKQVVNVSIAGVSFTLENDAHALLEQYLDELRECYKYEQTPQEIMEELGRGVTRWQGEGAYTNEASSVLCVCINRYEMEKLERIVKGADPQAFIITTHGVRINGNFIHKV